jgi:hypothetical protein
VGEAVTDDLIENDKLDALEQAVEDAKASGEVRGALMGEVLRLWKEGVFPDGTKAAGDAVRRDAFKILMNLVGKESGHEELRIRYVLDAKAGTEICPECGKRIRVDPRVSDQDAEEMFG